MHPAAEAKQTMRGKVPVVDGPRRKSELIREALGDSEHEIGEAGPQWMHSSVCSTANP